MQPYPYSPTLDDAFRYLPGGHIMTGGLNSPARPTFLFSHGEGAYIYTTDGRRLLDTILGAGVHLLGHGAAPVVEAARAQLERGINFMHPSPPSVELARLVVEAIPGAYQARFFSSGSEAVLCAARLIRAHTGKEKILKFAGSYHGFSDALMYNTNYGHPDAWADAPQATVDSAGIPASQRDLVLVTPYNDIARARQIVRDNHKELAGIFAEPLMRGIEPAPGFLEGIRELATQYHLPLVFDEVGTGFRIAYGGAQEFYGITADLAVFGKALGAGFPIGAIAGSEELMRYLDPASPDERRIYALGSFYGNAMSAAVAVANLNELRKPGTYEHLAAYGAGLRQGLAEIFARYRLPAQITGVASFAELFFMSEPITDYLSTQRSNLRLKGLMGAQLPLHGVWGGGGRYNASVCHGDAELAVMLGAVDESLRAVKAAGGF